MKRLFILALLALASTSSTFSQTPAKKTDCPKQTGSNVEQMLIQLDKDWTAAELRGDKSIVGCYVADDFRMTGPEGRVLNKMQYLETIQASTDKDVADDYEVRAFGNMAIMTHRGTATRQDGRTEQYRSTHVWAKRGDRWQIVQHHSSPILPAQGQTTAANAASMSATKPDTKNFDAYVGQYDTGSQELGILSITQENGKLYGKPPNDQKVELTPQGNDKFFASQVNVPLTFFRDDKGQVTSLLAVLPDGREVRAQKIKQ